MSLIRIALLCLLTALLPFDGIARAAQPACAAHGAATTTGIAPAQHAHAHHAGMAMTGMTHDAPSPAHVAAQHGGCHCAGLCAAHCASTAATVAMNVTAGTTIDARTEVPAALAGRDPRPARRLDLLRPPATTHA